MPSRAMETTGRCVFMRGAPFGGGCGGEQAAHDRAAEVGAEQGVGLVHAAGAGHVDLDQPAGDHVEPGQGDAVRGQQRARGRRRSSGPRRRARRARRAGRSGSRRRTGGGARRRRSRRRAGTAACCRARRRPGTPARSRAGCRRGWRTRPASAAASVVAEQPDVEAGEAVDRLDDRGADAADEARTTVGVGGHHGRRGTGPGTAARRASRAVPGSRPGG